MEESFVRGPWWGLSYENMEMSIIDYGIASVSFGFFYFSALSRSMYSLFAILRNAVRIVSREISYRF